MEQLFGILDALVYGAAVIGGLLAVLWIYNSTVKERRDLIRRAGKSRDPALRRTLTQGLFYHRMSFSVAAAATSLAILWFARAYRARHGADVAPAYIIFAIVLAVGGVAGAALALWGRRKED